MLMGTLGALDPFKHKTIQVSATVRSRMPRHTHPLTRQIGAAAPSTAAAQKPERVLVKPAGALSSRPAARRLPHTRAQ